MEKTLSATIETTSLDAASDNRSEEGYFGVSTQAWGRIIVIGVLFACVFWPNLRRLWLKTNPFTGEANWSHSIFVPLIGLYYLFVNREALIKAGSTEFIWGSILRPGRAVVAAGMAALGMAVYFMTVHRDGRIFTMASDAGAAIGMLGILVFLLDWSLGIILYGLAMFVFGIYPGQNDYLKDVGMVITLFGIVLMLNGWNVMRIAWFPVVFLICAIPWPPLAYSWVAGPLSHMAAYIAVHVLKLTGVDAFVDGTKIVIYGQLGMPPRTLNVEEACAGMRSLLTFIAVAGAVAFLPARALWQRLTIVFSAVPIAIFCNMARISVTGLLDHYVSQKWSDSFAHQFVGMIMLLPAFFLILLVGYALDKIFIEEADDNEAGNSKPGFAVAIAPRPAAIPAKMTSPAIPVSQPKLPQKPLIPQQTPPPSAAQAQVAPPRPAVLPPRPAGAPTPPRPVGAPTPPRPVTAIPRPPIIPGGGVPRTNPAIASPAPVAPRPPAARPPAPRPPAPPRSSLNPEPYKPVAPVSPQRPAKNGQAGTGGAAPSSIGTGQKESS